MKLSHIHEDDKPQLNSGAVDPLKVRIVVENDILKEPPPELDNPLDNIIDEFRKEAVVASISVEIRHNTKGVLETFAGEFDEGVHWPFSRHEYYLNTTGTVATTATIAAGTGWPYDDVRRYGAITQRAFPEIAKKNFRIVDVTPSGRDITDSEFHQCILHIAHDAWYTMYYTDDWGVTPEHLDDNWSLLNPEDDQWLNRPMRSEFTLTWNHFMDIAEGPWNTKVCKNAFAHSVKTALLRYGNALLKGPAAG